MEKRFLRFVLNIAFCEYYAVRVITRAEGWAMVERKQGEPFVVDERKLLSAPPKGAYRVVDDWEAA